MYTFKLKLSTSTCDPTSTRDPLEDHYSPFGWFIIGWVYHSFSLLNALCVCWSPAFFIVLCGFVSESYPFSKHKTSDLLRFISPVFPSRVAWNVLSDGSPLDPSIFTKASNFIMGYRYSQHPTMLVVTKRGLTLGSTDRNPRNFMDQTLNHVHSMSGIFNMFCNDDSGI